MGLYFTIREKLRFNPLVNKIIYLSQSLYPSYFGRLAKDVRRAGQNATAGNGVALCLRFRDEARFLPEWLEYYLAAGVDHFYLYNNFSEDGFRSVIQPWVDTGLDNPGGLAEGSGLADRRGGLHPQGAWTIRVGRISRCG